MGGTLHLLPLLGMAMDTATKLTAIPWLTMMKWKLMLMISSSRLRQAAGGVTRRLVVASVSKLVGVAHGAALLVATMYADVSDVGLTMAGRISSWQQMQMIQMLPLPNPLRSLAMFLLRRYPLSTQTRMKPKNLARGIRIGCRDCDTHTNEITEIVEKYEN